MKFKCVLICLISALFLSGCSHSEQIHQKLIVQGISVDKFQQDYVLTIQALDFQNPAGEEEPGIKILETRGASLAQALENISGQTDLSAVYSQNLILILGKSAAEGGVNHFMDFFVRHCEARPKVKIAVASGNASDLLKITSNQKTFKAKNICDLIPGELNCDILHFVSNLKNESSDPYAAWLEKSDNPSNFGVCLKGVAVFSKDTFKEFLDKESAAGFMLLKGVPNFESIIVKSPENVDFTCNVKKISSKISCRFKDETPCFDAELSPEVSVFSSGGSLDSCFDESAVKAVKKEYSKKITDICLSVINKLANINTDVFNFGKILKNSYPKCFKKLESTWKTQLKNCIFNVSVNADLKVVGKEPM